MRTVSWNKITFQAEYESSIQRNELGDATLESLLVDLVNSEASVNQTGEETPLYLKFKALVYLHPAGCRDGGRAVTVEDGLLVDQMAEPAIVPGSRAASILDRHPNVPRCIR